MKKQLTVKECLEFLSRCPNCDQQNCGDDSHVLSIIEAEKNVGAVTKCILTYIYQLVEYHGLQKSEIIALISDLVENHIEEQEDISCD